MNAKVFRFPADVSWVGTPMSCEQPIQCEPEQLEDWLPVIEQATREVFAQMVNSQLDVPKSHSAAVSNVTAMVGLAGMLTGVMSIRCEEEAAALMASRMLGINLEDASASVADAIGEICNMVAGNFKYKVPGLGDGCLLSPPTVVRGGDYTVHARPKTPRIHVHLLLENMPVMISLYVAGRSPAKRKV
jgi:chemotaxis protein CheX